MFRHPTIQMVINKAWFADQHSIGVIHQDFFVDNDGALHNEVIALVVTAVSWSSHFFTPGLCADIVFNDLHRYDILSTNGKKVSIFLAAKTKDS